MQDQKKYPYDVFISYRWITPDQEWVREQLHPALVKAGLKVFLDVEDSVPGRHLILEMERAVLESRHVLSVISPEYFEEGRMVEFESLSARRRDPAGRYSFLIPLIVRETEIPERLRGLIPIIWIDPNDYAREWKKLLGVLRAANLNAPPPGSLQTELQNPSDAFPPKVISSRIEHPFQPTAVRQEAGLGTGQNRQLRIAIYVTAVLVIITFSSLALRQVFSGKSETSDVKPTSSPQASPQPTTTPTPSPTATPMPSSFPSPSIRPVSPKKRNVSPNQQRNTETNGTPGCRMLGLC